MIKLLPLLYLSIFSIQELLAASSDEELLAWEAPKDMIEDCPYYLTGYEDGVPIWLIPFGSWKDKKHMQGKNRRILSKYVDQGVARAIASGKNGTEFLMVVDLKGMNGGLLDPKLLFFAEKTNAVFKVINGNEMKHFWLVNGDPLIVTLVNAFKITLTKPKADKIEAFTKTNFKKASESIAKVISEENLIEAFGGSAEFDPESTYG